MLVRFVKNVCDIDLQQEEGPGLDFEPVFEGLAEASGLDIDNPSGMPPLDISSYHVVVKKTADLLGLSFATKEARSNLLMQV